MGWLHKAGPAVAVAALGALAGCGPAGPRASAASDTSAAAAPHRATPNPSSLHMVDAEHGWGTFFGTILRTADGGQTWQDVSPPGTGDILPQPGYFLDAEHAWVILYGGYSGGPWQSATDAQASVLRTADGGVAWHAGRLPLAGPVSAQYGVETYFLDPRHGWALAHVDTALHPEERDDVALFSTSDGGASWSALPGAGLPATGWKVGITFRTPRDGWITGRSADGTQLLLVTHDGGRSWARATVPLPADIAHAANGYTILAPTFWGDQGVLPVCAFVTGFWPTVDVFRTEDGGAHWTGGASVQANTGDPCTSPQLGFTDPLHGWFMDDTAYAFTTDDGGRSWTQIHPATRYAQVDGIDFWRRDVGWAVVWQGVTECSSLPVVVRTIDGGLTWTVLAPAPAMAGVPHSCPAPLPTGGG